MRYQVNSFQSRGAGRGPLRAPTQVSIPDVLLDENGDPLLDEDGELLLSEVVTVQDFRTILG